ncbi:MAM and LDL-receptor class A domain-containing protein 1-like isoform X3 [Mercenaria mercenaria]|uniref:MAM and LDL-receptor class A domain-containing protein 1-like isoform X3 n=1 Tax=Mercenaria mercenaria TaxID=6596 RepID=UPI00234E689D|nr:MAM and LDL-receptor class A domain-containing protein 1-like isoform X3 [Mercenaria mercenaria]
MNIIILSSTECTFEDGFCDWENTETGKWIRTQGDSMNDSLPSPRTKTDGFFIAITNNRTESETNTVTAKVISPPYSLGLACFRLWYSLTTRRNSITVNVRKTTGPKKRVTVAFLRNTDKGKWMQVYINLNHSTSFKIEIVGNLGNDNAGYVAVDDTVITSGILCSADCDFENGFCAWKQLLQKSEDDFNWKRRRGSTPSENTGPENDHTSGDGYYIYIESNKKEENNISRLTVLLDGIGQKCFSFWFYMYGDDVNSLHVYVETHADGEKRVFSAHKSKGKQWIEAQIEIIDKVYQIILEGVIGAGDLGDIAVDDITIRSGACKPSEKGGSLIAVYILVPIIITIIVVVGSVAIFIWRKRCSSKRTPSDVPRSSITNKTYTGHIVENQNNNKHAKASKTASDGSEYAVITDDNIQPQDSNKTEYNTINMNQKVQHDRDYGYDRLKHTLSPFVDKSYSHVLPNDNNSFDRTDGTEKPLAASRNENQKGGIDPVVSKSKEKTGIGSTPCDTTQNTPKFAFEMEDELDVEYDHAKAGGLDPAVAKRDDYSHLRSADSNAHAIKDRQENAKKDMYFAILEKDGNFEDDPGTQDSCSHDYFVLEKEQ